MRKHSCLFSQSEVVGKKHKSSVQQENHTQQVCTHVNVYIFSYLFNESEVVQCKHQPLSNMHTYTTRIHITRTQVPYRGTWYAHMYTFVCALIQVCTYLLIHACTMGLQSRYINTSPWSNIHAYIRTHKQHIQKQNSTRICTYRFIHTCSMSLKSCDTSTSPPSNSLTASANESMHSISLCRHTCAKVCTLLMSACIPYAWVVFFWYVYVLVVSANELMQSISLCWYAYMYVCMYVDMYVRAFQSMHMHAEMCLCMYKIFMHIYTHNVCIYIYIYIYISICICIQMACRAPNASSPIVPQTNFMHTQKHTKQIPTNGLSARPASTHAGLSVPALWILVCSSDPQTSFW